LESKNSKITLKSVNTLEPSKAFGEIIRSAFNAGKKKEQPSNAAPR
jgi:hypothetical protein